MGGDTVHYYDNVPTNSTSTRKQGVGLILAVMGDLFSRFFEPSRRDAELKSDWAVKCELSDTEQVEPKSDSAVKCELLDTEQVESDSAIKCELSDTEQVGSRSDSAVKCDLSDTEQVESKCDSAVKCELSDTEQVESKSDSAVKCELSDTEQVESKSDSAVKCELPTEEAKSYRDSAECRAFRKCFSVLADGITDPGWLAVQLYSSELIGRNIRREAQNQTTEVQVKIERLLSAVECQIMSDPATKFGKFLDVLQNEPSLQHLATRLEDTRSELACVPQPTPTCLSVDTYASYIKSVYKREKLPVYDKWPQVKSKKYINLALIEKEDIAKPEANLYRRATIYGNIDDIKKSNRTIDIDQVAQLSDESQPKCILVEGAPGVGKSTFAWKLCRKWGKGKLLQDYKLVVLLRLQDKSVRDANNISDLFRYHDHHIQQAAIEEIKRTGGKRVLLLFDGYDELPEELRTKNSIFLDIIVGRELPEATVLVTSRSWASEFLHRKCERHIYQHIEILGFTKDNIQSYLESTTLDDPSLLTDLQNYILWYPHINGLMYIPLNSAIVVEVYRNSRKDEILVPKTMTELYSSLVRSLLLRHLLEHPVHGKEEWRVRSFSDLPQEVYQQLCELGRIAYRGILHDQQVIFFDLPKNLETLGLMHCSPELYADEGTAVSYNFLHLTVQEYLAAFHLSQQPVEKQIEHFEKYKRQYHLQHHHFYMVLWFLCGLRKFEEYPSEELNTLMFFLELAPRTNDHVCGIDFNTLHWLFEAKDGAVIAKILGSSDIMLSNRQLFRVTPFDCFVLGYCVSHSKCTWIINLDYSGSRDEGVEMLVQGALENETDCTGGISAIMLSFNDITYEGVNHLLNFPKQLIDKLKILDLHNNELDSRSCEALAHLIPYMPHLKILDLSCNPNIGQGGAVPLIKSLMKSNVEELSLTYTRIGVEDCRALAKLLSSFTDLEKLHRNTSELCKIMSLQLLKIDGNYLPPEAVELIINEFHHSSLVNLDIDMSDSQFSLQNTISLGSVLRTNPNAFIRLSLMHCNIDSDGACQLASALHANDTLHTLNLRRNSI